VRSLGLNPTTAQLQSLQQAITAAAAASADATGTGTGAAPATNGNNNGSSLIALEQCESLIATWMLEMRDSLARDDFHVLMRAFQALDPDNRCAGTAWQQVLRILGTDPAFKATLDQACSTAQRVLARSSAPS